MAYDYLDLQGVIWRWIFGAENDCFWPVLGAYKRHTPLHIGLLSPQICTDLRGVKNPWKIGGNPPIGGKEYTWSTMCSPLPRILYVLF